MEVIDRWILDRSRNVAQEMTKEFEKYEFSRARKVFEDFFWGDYCDNYLEIIKGRLWNQEGVNPSERISAQYAAYHSFLGILKMISPFLAYIAEEMYHGEISDEGGFVSNDKSGFFAKREKEKSIHLSSWPFTKELFSFNDNEKKGADLMLRILSDVRRYKSEEKISLGAVIPSVVIIGSKEQEELLKPFWKDLIFATKVEKLVIENSKDKGEIKEVTLYVTI